MNKEYANQKMIQIMNKDYLLSKQDIELFKKMIYECDLNLQDKTDATPIIYALHFNKKYHLTREQWDYLIQNSDLKKQDEDGYTALLEAIRCHKEQELNFHKEQWDYLLKNSDLTQNTYAQHWNPIIYAFMNNQKQNLNFNEEQWNYLIQNSTIKSKNKIKNYNIIIYAIKYHQSENLNFNEEQWDYIIQNSDLTQQDKDGWTPLLFALVYHQEQNVNFSKKQLRVMYYALTEVQQQNTFQNFIQQNYNNQKYIEQINLFLYDLQFQPNEKTIKWLQENQYKDILKRIEKRNLWIQLQKKINQVEKKEKMSKIKI